MRKITEQAVLAFANGNKFKSGNTSVDVTPFDNDYRVTMRLHGNIIAEKYGSTNVLKIFDGGWQSNTTKERLNGLLRHYNLGTISAKNFIWYIGGVVSEEFTGFKSFKI